jgi:2-phospho-L-lactate/phosphoenolpyruvate guanylyltransferase
MRTVAILPVKRFSAAKQRLGAGVEEGLRAQLAKAMAGDVLSALRDCSAIDATIVVTCEPSVAAAARYLGATVVEDTAESGQSAAASIGLARAVEDGFERALCVPGDCPALDPDEVAALLRSRQGRSGTQSLATAADASARAHSAEVVIVPDRHDTGTNGLLLTPPEAIVPSFGPDSRARHEQLAQAARASVRVERLSSLVLDVDTAEDLAVLRERLQGEAVRAPRTRAVLARSQAARGSASQAA